MAKEGHGHGFAPTGLFVHDAVEVVDQAEVVVGGHDDPVKALEGGEGRFLDIHRGRRDLTGEVLFLEISIPGKKEKLIGGYSGPRSFLTWSFLMTQ